MQTFMTCPDYKQTAMTLDAKRLGKQRVEAARILAALLGVRWDAEQGEFGPLDANTRASLTHPAFMMWSGHEGSLLNYTLRVCDEWMRRGFNDSIGVRVQVNIAPRIGQAAKLWVDPAWLANTEVCSSHRSILLAKDPSHYSKFGWLEKPAVRDPTTGRWPYVWPVSTTAA